MRPVALLPFLLLLAPQLATAEPAAGDPGAGEPPTTNPAAEDPELPYTPDAPDLIGGHLLAGAAPLFAVPFGDLESGHRATEQLAAGFGARVDLGFGVTRTLVLGVAGDFLSYGAPSSCASCGGQGYAIAPFVRYHLVQGTRFDPFVGFRVAYRSLRGDGPDGDRTFSGFDLAALSLGGNWYPLSGVAIGPFAEFGGGVYTKHATATSSARAHFDFDAGIRVSLDLPGR